jgi:5'-3' exoribonuclease 2
VVSYQGVVKLPFIEEDRLLLETGKVEETLSTEERLRNCISADKLLISSSHPLAPSVIALYNRYAYMRGQCQVEAIEEIDPIASQGMNGFIALGNEEPCPATIPSPVRGMLDITNNQVL